MQAKNYARKEKGGEPEIRNEELSKMLAVRTSVCMKGKYESVPTRVRAVL